MQPASTSLRRPVGQKRWRTTKATVKINYVVLLSKPCNFRLRGISNNLYGLIGMLNIDEDIALVDNSLKILQRQSVLQIQNERLIPAFLLSDSRIVFLSQNASPTFFNNASPAYKARPAF